MTGEMIFLSVETEMNGCPSDVDVGEVTASMFDRLLQSPPPVAVALTPDEATVARGEVLGWSFTIFNMTDRARDLYAWLSLLFPDQKERRLAGPLALSCAPRQIFDGHRTLAVPAHAPLGGYILALRVGPAGKYPRLWDEDSFRFHTVPVSPSP